MMRRIDGRVLGISRVFQPMRGSGPFFLYESFIWGLVSTSFPSLSFSFFVFMVFERSESSDVEDTYVCILLLAYIWNNGV